MVRRCYGRKFKDSIRTVLIKKNIHIASFQGFSNPFLPVLWPSAKTYYEKYGKYPNNYEWVLPYYENTGDIEKIKKVFIDNPPDFLGVSLYVWNYEMSMEICEWVKENYPACIIVTGGPHQYFKHKQDWFKIYPFIDASLPSEIYGELAMSDILDNWNFKTNKVDWTKVEKIVFPTNDRSVWVQSPKCTYKRDFKWDFAPYKEQIKHIDEYVRLFYQDHVESNGLPMIHWKLETTRGCPYACTFCDWGGGVMSKVIVKDIKYIKEDLDVITKYGIATIYVCDANFGINGDRDVEVVEYIVQKKKELKRKHLYVHYGGYAKTNKHFDTLKKIFTLEAENDLSYLYKISVQSTDAETLANIKRTDLREDEHWQLADWLRDTYKYEAHVELIVGLPGMTLDKWYNEFNHPYLHNAEVRAYEWHLLPESEAFNKEYRDKFILKTGKKIMNKSKWHIPSEVVVGASSYTHKDYVAMWLSHSLYLLLHRGGIYSKTIRDIIDKHNMPFGQFLRKFTEEVYPRFKITNEDAYVCFEDHLEKVTGDTENDYRYTMPYRTNNGTVYHIAFVSFFLIEYFLNFNKLDPIMQDWLLKQGANPKLMKKDSELIMNSDRINKTKIRWLSFIQYNKFDSIESLIKELNLTMTYSTTGILLGNTLI